MDGIVYSIIIPVYNVEEYLSACIESIVGQRSKFSYEIIIVDDGSTDASGEICDRFAGDERVKVIHQKNSGVSVARNTGIAHSVGKYLLFVDGDDLWREDTLAVLDRYVEEGYDTLLFGYYRLKKEQKQEERVRLLLDSGSGRDYLNLCMQEGVYLPGAPWRYAYGKSIVEEKGIRFDEKLKVGEDYDFTIRYLPHSLRFCTVDESLYIYRYRASSLTASLSAEKVLMNMENRAKHYATYSHTLFADHFVAAVMEIPYILDKSKRKEVIRAVKKYNRIVKKSKRYRLPKTLICLLGTSLGLKTYCWIHKLYHARARGEN